jgi:hypothetical protein
MGSAQDIPRTKETLPDGVGDVEAEEELRLGGAPMTPVVPDVR